MKLGEKLSEEEYNRRQGLRSTQVKIAGKSLAHFKAIVIDNLDTTTKAQQKNFDRGSAQHWLNLESDMSRMLVFEPKKEYAKPKATNEWAEFEEQCRSKGKVPVLSSEAKEYMISHSAFWKDSNVQRLMSGCEKELSFFAKDPITGLTLKAKIDGINLREQRVLDYKTDQSANPLNFAKKCARLKYHVSAAHYIYVVELATGQKITKFDFIVQEKSRPYLCTTLSLSEWDIEESTRYHRELLNKISVALRSNEWPGYESKGDALVLPPWAYEFEDEDFSEGVA